MDLELGEFGVTQILERDLELRKNQPGAMNPNFTSNLATPVD
jgi:hypothetical protein